MTALIVAFSVGIRVSQEPAPANTMPPLTEEEAAIEAFLNPIPIEVARRDPQFAADEAISTLMMTHPELGLAERRRDPAFVEAEQKAALCILQPALVEAELRKDPEFVRQQAAAFQALSTGASD
jgi:hypothetical protein